MMILESKSIVDIVVDQDYMKHHNIDYSEGIKGVLFIKSTNRQCAALQSSLSHNTLCTVEEEIGNDIVAYSPHSLSDELKGYYPNYKFKSFDVSLSVFQEGLDIGFLIFQDPESLESAQLYMDNKFLEYGVKPTYVVESLAQEIAKDRNNFMYYYKTSLATTLFILCAYVMLTITTYEVDIEENKTRYMLELVEGKTEKSFMFRNVFESFPIYFLIILFAYLSKIAFLNMLVILTCVILIDLAAFLVMLKTMKGRDE